jgi:hypothetical protein
MRLRERAVFLFRPCRVPALVIALLGATLNTHAASLPTFIVVFGELTNEIASIEKNFDNSSAQKQQLAVLTRATSLILDEELRDEQVLSRLLPLIGSDSDYTITLNESAANARAAVLGRYDLIGLRVVALPPSHRAAIARNHFENLADDRAALGNAQSAAGISSLLAPFGTRLETVNRLVMRAKIMPRPRVGLNAVRAVVDGHRFVSSGGDRHSPNIFEVTAPTSLYRAVTCRAVDGERVINFNLPVVTDQVRYEVAQGLAGASYSPDVFATNAMTLTATSGTFFVQSERNEVYGIFSCAGPGFEIRDGRFRIEVPRALRGP